MPDLCELIRKGIRDEEEAIAYYRDLGETLQGRIARELALVFRQQELNHRGALDRLHTIYCSGEPDEEGA